MSNFDWGTVPDWLAAIGTVGALMLGMSILRNDNERQRADQAAHVAVWERGGKEPLLSGALLDRGEYVVTLHNQSQQPVTAPSVVAHLAPPHVLEHRLGHKGIPSAWVSDEEPIETAVGGIVTDFADSFKDQDGVSVSHIPPGAIVEHSVPLPLPRPCYDITVSFRDAAGQLWTRDVSSGTLSPSRSRGLSTR